MITVVIIKLLVELVSETFPEVSKLLVDKRYVDDFGQSTSGKRETATLMKETSEVLGKIKMKVNQFMLEIATRQCLTY